MFYAKKSFNVRYRWKRKKKTLLYIFTFYYSKCIYLTILLFVDEKRGKKLVKEFGSLKTVGFVSVNVFVYVYHTFS